MNNYLIISKHLLFGVIASYIPIILTSFAFKNSFIKNQINYLDIVKYTPIFFAIIHTIVIIILNNLGLKNLFIIGALLSIIYSSIGRFIFNIPVRLFEMNNPNLFHIKAFIIWSLFYGIVGHSYYKCLM